MKYLVDLLTELHVCHVMNSGLMYIFTYSVIKHPLYLFLVNHLLRY